MKLFKGIVLLILLTTVNANAFSMKVWWNMAKTTKLSYKASQKLFVSKTKIHSTHAQRKAEFYEKPYNKGKKFPKLKVWTKSMAKASQEFLKKPSIAVWYKSIQNGKLRYIGRNSKTGLTIVFTEDFLIITCYFSTKRKIKNRLKKGTLTHIYRKELKETLGAKRQMEKLAKEDALTVNYGLWW